MMWDKIQVFGTISSKFVAISLLFWSVRKPNTVSSIIHGFLAILMAKGRDKSCLSESIHL